MSTIVKMPFTNPADVAFALKEGVWDNQGMGPMGKEGKIDKLFIYPTKKTVELFGKGVTVLVATDVQGSIISNDDRLVWPTSILNTNIEPTLNNIRYKFGKVVPLSLEQVEVLFPEVAEKSLQGAPTGSYVSR